jgi:hypothetical protein
VTTAVAKDLWDTAPLWRSAVYVALLTTAMLGVRLVFGVSNPGTSAPPMATGSGTYRSPYPAPPAPTLAPAVSVPAPARPSQMTPQAQPAKPQTPSRRQDASDERPAPLRPIAPLDPALLQELQRQPGPRDQFGTMPPRR